MVKKYILFYDRTLSHWLVETGRHQFRPRVSAGILLLSLPVKRHTPAWRYRLQPWTSIEVLKPVGEHRCSHTVTEGLWTDGFKGSGGKNKEEGEKRGRERKREKGKHSWRRKGGKEEGTEQGKRENGLSSSESFRNTMSASGIGEDVCKI